MLTKKQIRSTILLRLKTQEEKERIRKSKKIREKLFKLDEFKKAKRIMFYISCGGEVNTKEMIRKAIKQGKIIAVPVCNRRRKTISPYRIGLKTRLKKGLYGILEPQRKWCIPKEAIDLVVVPAVAFDIQGNRLGRGKGYYDHFLKSIYKTTPCIGLAFDFQILPSLPATKRDVKIDKVIFA